MSASGGISGRRVAVVVGVFVLASAAIAGLWFLRSPGAVRLRVDDRAVVAKGQDVSARECASCHGARLEGQPNWRQPGADGRLPAPPHDASGHTWHHPDELLFRLVKYGTAKVANMPNYQSAMPIYEGRLSDDDILAALSYIKSQWPKDVRVRHDELNRAAAQSR